jgi:hypothetical protein
VLVVTLWSLDVEEREERRDILKDSGQKGKEEEAGTLGGPPQQHNVSFN